MTRLNDSIYLADDESVVQVSYAKKEDIERSLGKKLSDAEYQQFCYNKLIPKTSTLVLHNVDTNNLPDSDLFDAWTIHNGQVVVNAKKAKDILLAKNQLEISKKQGEIDKRVIVGDDATSLYTELQALKDKRARIKSVDVSKVNHKADAAVNNAKLAELKGV